MRRGCVSQCPNCLTALPRGASGCSACGSRFVTAEAQRDHRRRAWSVLVVALALAGGSLAWWSGGREVERDGSDERLRTGRETSLRADGSGAPASTRAPPSDVTEGPVGSTAVETAPTPVVADPVAHKPPVPVALETFDGAERRLRSVDAFVVAPPDLTWLVVPLAALNGARRVQTVDGAESLELAGLDGGDLAFLVQHAGGGAPAPWAQAAIAGWDELALDTPLYAGLAEAPFGRIVRRDGRERLLVVAVTDGAVGGVQFVRDAGGRLVGSARSAEGGECVVVTFAGALERAARARPLSFDSLQSGWFERDALAQRELAGWYAAAGLYAVALERWLAAGDLDPSLAPELVRPATAAAELALREARLRDALGELLPLLERAARRFDREPRVLHSLGLALLDDGDAEAALPWFVRAVELAGSGATALNDSLRAAYLHAGESARADARPADAIALLEEGLARYREEPGMLLALGYAYYEIGDRERAAIVLTKAASLDEGHAAALAPLLATLQPTARPTDGAAVEIRFERAGGAIRSTARFAGRVDAGVIVDTGASLTAISERLADRLGIDRRRPLRVVTVNTANGKVEAPVVDLESIDLHGARVTNVEAVVLPLEDDGGGEALLGLNFLEHFDLSLDARRGVLRLGARR